MKGSDFQRGRKVQNFLFKTIAIGNQTRGSGRLFKLHVRQYTVTAALWCLDTVSLRKWGKTRQDKSFYQAHSESQLGVMLKQRRENEL